MYYYCLLRIPCGEEHFLEVGSYYDLPFHPNLTDEIIIMEYTSVIREIYYTLEDLHNDPNDKNNITMRLEAIDNLYVCESEEEALECLKLTWTELKEWDPDLILNDYSVNPKNL